MTTLAYSRKENIIAVDGRLGRGGTISTDTHKKWTKKEGKVYFYAGGLADALRLIELVSSGCDEIEDENLYDCQLILAEIPPKDIYVNEAGYIECIPIDEEFYTIGSGGDHALSALDLGMTAKQAIQHAMTRDMNTGGKISQYDLTKGKFK